MATNKKQTDEKKKTSKGVNRDAYFNDRGRFKVGNPGRVRGSKNKAPGFRKVLLSMLEKIGEEAFMNYLSQNVVFKKGEATGFKYDLDKDGNFKNINTERFENLLNLLAKTTPKTEMEDDGEDGNGYESRMSKVGKQLESNPSLKKQILDDLEDEA